MQLEAIMYNVMFIGKISIRHNLDIPIAIYGGVIEFVPHVYNGRIDDQHSAYHIAAKEL